MPRPVVSVTRLLPFLTLSEDEICGQYFVVNWEEHRPDLAWPNGIEVKDTKDLEQARVGLDLHMPELTSSPAAPGGGQRAQFAERGKAEAPLPLLAALLAAVSDGAIVTDERGIILWANPAFTSMTGYSAQEVRGQRPRLWNSGHHRPEFFAELWDTLLSKQVWQGEIVNQRRDGSLYLEEQTITPILDGRGEIAQFVAIKRDVSRRKKAGAALEAEHSRLFSLLDELPAIVYLKAPDYTIRYANRRFRARFGDPASDLCYRLIHNRDVPCEPCTTLSVLKDGQPVEWEWTFPDGTSCQFYDYPFVDVDGTELVLQLGIDITERRQALAQLERSNQALLELSRSERRQRLFAEGLVQATMALNTSLELDEVLDRILGQIQRVIPAYGAAVMLLEEGSLRLARHRGTAHLLESAAYLGSGVPLDEFPVLRRSCEDRQAVLIPDTATEPEWRVVPGLEWVRSLLSVPLVSDSKAIGLIAQLSEKSGFFAEDSLDAVQAFAPHAVVAIQNAQLFREAQDRREQLQKLSRRLVGAQELERQFIARELHDEASNALTSLKVQLRLLERQAGDPSTVLAGIAELRDTIEEVMANLHGLAADLRPASLDHVGLVAALRQHCKTIRERHGLVVEFEALGLQERLPPAVETALYRVVQEALTNVVRHAQAAYVSVILEQREGTVVAIVEDDGVGLAAETRDEQDRLGLIGMRERAESLGGTLTIESTSESGTTILVEVPYAD